MYEMIERFVCLKKCILKALLALSIEHDISTAEFLFLNELKCALEPIKLAVDALCNGFNCGRNFSNFYFLSRRRGSQALRKICFVTLKKPVQQRRQYDEENLICYLPNPNL